VKSPLTVITLHHFPGSGGTVLSKAIAAMHDTLVLSEIHPDRDLASRFDPIKQLRTGYREILDQADMEDLDAQFVNEIETLWRIAARHNRVLVIRDHSYRDYIHHTDRDASRLVTLLSRKFSLTKLVSLRDPVDMYLSYEAMRARTETMPALSPEQLCSRFLRFADGFPDATFVRYEDFVEQPALILEGLSARLRVRFNPEFAEAIPTFTHFTGDSGRGGERIAPRARRAISDETRAAFAESPSYAAACIRFAYEPISASAAAAA
jgi:hypothetical protein